MNYIKSIFFFLAFILAGNFIQAQEEILLNDITDGKTIITCDALFYDNGGPFGSYERLQNRVITFCPDAAPGAGVVITFSVFDVAQEKDQSGDTLIIFQGKDTLGPRFFLGERNFFSNGENPLPLNTPIIATDESGCITFQFKTDEGAQTEGWEAKVECRYPFQKIEVELTDTFYVVNPETGEKTARPYRYERSDNDTTHFLYIDICKGDSIILEAKVSFPENGIYYDQKLEECETRWDVGDRITSYKGMGVTSISHRYSRTQGYLFSFSVTDKIGSKSKDHTRSSARVRIAENPIREITPLPEICTDVDYILGVGLKDNILINEIEVNSNSQEKYEKLTFIPDKCKTIDGDTAFSNSVTFTTFGDAILESGSDICGICLNIEHSYMGELRITLICPSGKSVDLKSQVWAGNDQGAGGMRNAFMFGIPHGGGNYTPSDDNSYRCIPEKNPAGIPFLYCWTGNENFSYNLRPPMNTELDPLFMISATAEGWPSTTRTLDSTHYFDESGYFTPAESFDKLIGCPLNGTWNLRIYDAFPADNGYVFDWSLDLCSSKYKPWTYSVPVDTVEWTGEGLTPIDASTVLVNQKTGGLHTYGIRIIDHNYCAWDTVASQFIVQTPAVELGNDTVLCDDASILLDAGACSDCPNNPYKYKWEPSGETTQTIYTNPNLTKTQVYKVEVINAFRDTECSVLDEIKVTIGKKPLMDIEPDKFPLEGCEPFDVSFKNNSLLATSYLWSFGDGTFSAKKSPKHTYAGGKYPLVFYAFSEDGCKDSIAETIHVFTTPKPNFTWDPVYPTVKDPSIQLINKTDSLNAENMYLWQIQLLKTDPNSYTYIRDSVNPFFQWNSSGNDLAQGVYQVGLFASTVNIAPSGTKYVCIDSMFYNVRIINDFLQFPNVVTPNGDGINDVFRISSLVDGMAYPNNELAIFDRFGRRIFYKKNIRFETDFWDPNSTNTKSGTYFYRFIGKGYKNDVEYKGSIEVLTK